MSVCKLSKYVVASTLVVALLGAFASLGHGANYYWDTNTTVGIGAGGTNDWTATNLWNTSSLGAVGTNLSWTDGNSAIFNGIGTTTVTVNSPITTGGSPGVSLANAPANGTSTTVNFSGSSTLTITGGYFGIGWTTSAAGNTATAVFNQTGGTIVANGGMEVGRFGTDGTFNLSGGSIDVTGNFRIANNTVSGGTVAPKGLVNITGGTMTVNGSALIGAIGQSGRVANGTLTISGTGSYVGQSIILSNAAFANGTINLNGGSLTTNSIGTPNLTNGTSTVNFNGGTLKAGAASATFLAGITRANVRNGGAIIDTNGFNITIGQALVHSNIGGDAATDGGLTKLGGQTLTLTGVNTYTGVTNVSDGTLQIGNGGTGTLGTGGTNIASGATLRFNTTSYHVDAGGIKYGGALTGTGNVVIDGPLATNLMRFNGDNSAFAGTFSVLAGSRTSFHSANSGSAAAKFIVDGTLSGQASNGATLHFGELSGASTGSLGGGGTTTVVNWSIGALNTNSIFHGKLQNGGGLTKVGTGQLTLTNTNTYSGATNITGGTLQVDGSIASSSGVAVGAGARLSGSGFVPTISGAGLVSPGISPGILTAPQVDPAGGLDFAFEFTAPGSPNYAAPTASINDVLALTGATPFTAALDADNTLSFYFDVPQIVAGDDFRGGFFVSDESYDLLGAVAGADLQLFVRGDGGGNVAFNGVNYYPLATLYPGMDFVFSTAQENGGQVLQITATPEPASVVIWLCAGLGAFVASWRFASLRKA